MKHKPCEHDGFTASAPGQAFADRTCTPCWMVHNRPDDPSVRAWRGLPPKPTPLPAVALPVCSAEGPILERCTACGAAGELNHVRDCSHPDNPTERCTRGPNNGAVWNCTTCPHHSARKPPDPFEPRPGDVPCGVVIGAYKWPALIDLQIRLIRHTCGPVPILVSDDDPDRRDRLAAVCARYPDVTHDPNPERIGHTGGDIACLWKGVRWGKERGLAVVAKLSQRFLATRPRWLQDGAANLLASRLPLATRRAITPPNKRIPKGEFFQLRTEAMLLDVAAWSNPAVLTSILPRKYMDGQAEKRIAEDVVYDTLRDHLGGVFLPWLLFGEDRHVAAPGVVWHNSHQRPDYDALAAVFGVTLPADFHVAGWGVELKKGSYLFG